jgi:CheY-like chemotaxis protein
MSPIDVTLVLVEDDDVDAEAVRRALQRAGISNPIVRVRDGIEALDLLRGTAQQEKLVPPYLLLVDIRMPRLDGIGLINALRAEPELSRTVVFVLTTSDSEKDKLAAYDASISGYIVKSDAGGDFNQLMQLLEYYLLIVTPPPS